MQDLVGRLRSLDPEASESLAVIAYFDRMLESDVSVSALVRGAAMLSAARVGHRSASASVRFSADGRALPVEGAVASLTHVMDDSSYVWLERTDRPHANDELVLERLALAIGVSSRRPGMMSVADQLETLLHPADRLEPAVAQEHLTRLRLAPRGQHRAIACPLAMPDPGLGPSAVLATSWGPVRATIAADGAAAPPGVGVGMAVVAERLPESWASALFALRVGELSGSMRADDYGSLWDLARRVEESEDRPIDVDRVVAAMEHGWSESELAAVAAGASLRAIAEIRGLHHSSIAARMPALIRVLAFDPQTPLGRTRLHVALLLRRAMTTTFPETG